MALAKAHNAGYLNCPVLKNISLITTFVVPGCLYIIIRAVKSDRYDYVRKESGYKQAAGKTVDTNG
jgi:hypothetical protein